jgi:hypothetical protein
VADNQIYHFYIIMIKSKDGLLKKHIVSILNYNKLDFFRYVDFTIHLNIMYKWSKCITKLYNPRHLISTATLLNAYDAVVLGHTQFNRPFFYMFVFS